jgi:hypothetical protein
MRIRQLVGPFAPSALYLLLAIGALFLAGCLFGGSDDSSTTPVIPKDSTATRKIVPGLYVGDYDWIDSNRYNLQSELLMDAGGTFEHLFIYDDEAAYDHRGSWAQSGGDFFFSNIRFRESDGGVFDQTYDMEDDTNSVRDVTDSTFIRKEWTPLRQKPYWITYKKKAFPKLAEGDYYHHVLDTFTIVADTSDTTGAVDTIKVVDNLYRFEIDRDSLLFSTTVDTLETYQVDATYRQLGSFLITEHHRIRGKDSTNAFEEWEPRDGIIIVRLKGISDTAFTLWTPPYSPEPNGYLPYSKNGK